MSVDYYTCHHCEDTFPDCGYYVRCQSCGTKWCSDECAEEDGYIPEHCSIHKDLKNRDLMEQYRDCYCDHIDCCDCGFYEPDSCKYCRCEDYEDSFLLEKALEILGISRYDLINAINKGV